MSLNIHTPISRLSLSEDRSMVFRREQLDWPGGSGELVIEKLSPLLVDSSLQIILSQGKLGAVKVIRYRERLGSDETESQKSQAELQQESETLQSSLRVARHRRKSLVEMMKVYRQ